MSETAGFWARRRAAVEAETRAEERASEAALRAEEQQAFEDKSDDEILAELDLPAPESLKPGDDFSAFMAHAVPDRLRRRALRMLWRTNPVLANLDQLVDYGDDFTDSALVVENLQTAYQVGKGMLKHIEKMAAESAAREAPADEAPDNADIADAAVADVAEPVPASMSDAAPPTAMLPSEPADDADYDADDAALPATPRRMTFAFETDTA